MMLYDAINHQGPWVWEATTNGKIQVWPIPRLFQRLTWPFELEVAPWKRGRRTTVPQSLAVWCAMDVFFPRAIRELGPHQLILTQPGNPWESRSENCHGINAGVSWSFVSNYILAGRYIVDTPILIPMPYPNILKTPSPKMEQIQY